PGFGTVLPEHRLALVLGPGETVIHDALTNQLAAGVALVVLVAKLFATLATIGSGGSAGLLVPSLFFGSMIAAFFSKV
ncbi:MAG: chloride channel protein, partial [Anaerolineales bacterium]|nr:chloride channel protein [Anaerolineales bacterium]